MVALSAAMHSAAAVCPTSFQRSQFPWFLQHKLTVLPFGVPVAFFSPTPEDAEFSGEGALAATLGRPGNELIVAHCPQASPADGMTALARGLAALLRARPSAHAALVLDGRPPVDPLALDGGLDPARLHLVLAPDAEQRRELHRAAAVHLVVGARSPRPDLLLEAQACGGLVVAAGPGMTDTVQHGVTGYLAAPEGRSLAELANWVLDHRSRLAEVRRAARQFVVAGFDEVHQAQRWVELLAGVHAQAASPRRVPARPQRQPSPAGRGDGTN
jgi:glycosyltransferase involved in cell wall biosynthesis